MLNPFSATLIAALMAVVLLGATGCSDSERPPTQAVAPPPAAPAQETPELEELGEPADPRFIGKIWVSTTPGHSRGSLMIFLPDRSLLMTSCFETYRITKWGAAGDRIRWIEQTFPIEAIVSMPDENNLQLQLAGQDRVQSYVTATVPYVCPDMAR